ncbi:MAG: glycosyltransferase family 2 protein [Casimicrobiaceae bacterium]
MTTTPEELHPVLSVIVPMHNEAAGLDRLFARLRPLLEATVSSFEVVCVDDGSTDETFSHLRRIAAGDARIRVLRLSRNFGKETAMTAGLDFASGQAVIPLDADLQDPPEVIPVMVRKWREGYDIVYAIRQHRSSDGTTKRATAGSFYRLFNRLADHPIPQDVGDFRLMDRRVVLALRGYRERTRFMKGLFASVGFHQTGIEYDREPRAAGASKWSYWQLWNLALEAITSFTSTPLRAWSYIGAALAVPAGLYAAWLVVRTVLFGIDVPGYASLAVMILLFGGLQLLSIGILGEYVARIFIEAKERPLYIVESTLGIADAVGQEVAERCRDVIVCRERSARI